LYHVALCYNAAYYQWFLAFLWWGIAVAVMQAFENLSKLRPLLVIIYITASIFPIKI
jgi:hypothetical protein